MLEARYLSDSGKWCSFKAGRKMKPYVFDIQRTKSGKIKSQSLVASGTMKTWNRRGKTAVVAIDHRGHYQSPLEFYNRAYIYFNGVQIRQLRKSSKFSVKEHELLKSLVKKSKRKKIGKQEFYKSIARDIYNNIDSGEEAIETGILDRLNFGKKNLKKVELRTLRNIYKASKKQNWTIKKTKQVMDTYLRKQGYSNKDIYLFGGMIGQVKGNKQLKTLDVNKFRKIHKFWVLDTEDNSEGEVKLIIFFDGQDFQIIKGDFELDTQILAVEFLNYLSKTHAKIFCVNLMYDLNNVFEEDYKDNKLCVANSSVLYMKLSFNKKDFVEFYESLRQIPLSVKALGELIGLQKIEVDNRVNVEYCKRDCEITHRALKKVFDFDEKQRIDFSISSASKSLKFWRRNYQQRDFNFHTFDFLRAGYRGGRTEIFRLGNIENVKIYDVNNLYGYVMSVNDYPNPDFADKTNHLVTGLHGIYKATVKVNQNIKIPTLGVIKNNKYTFPVGTFTGVWTNFELQYAIDHNEIADYTIIDGYVFGNEGRVFEDFVDYFYKLRIANYEDPIYNKLCKLYINSLYGKFAESEKHVLYNEEKDIFETVEEEFPLHTNYIWSIFTTSLARLELKKWLSQVPYSQLIYCDTDSIHTENFELPISDEIGQLKHEGDFDFGFYVAPKLYYVSGRETAKAKGIPKDKSIEFITTGSCKFQRPIKLFEYLRLRDSYFQGKVLNEWIWIEKEFHKENAKRKFDSFGFSLPRVFSE